MNIIELSDENIIAQIIKDCWHDNDDSFMPPLFHGTDASILGISRQTRECINNACEIVIKSICKLFEDNLISITDETLIKSKDNYGNSANAYVYAKARNNSSLYSYGNFYVTNDPSRAISYSKQAWIYGETGWVANRLIIGAEDLRIAFPQDDAFKNALELINIRKKMDKDPAVLMFVNVKTSECFMEDGDSIDPGKFSIFMEALKEKEMTLSLRLKTKDDLNDYSVFLIRECNYEKLVKSFNE